MGPNDPFGGAAAATPKPLAAPTPIDKRAADIFDSIARPVVKPYLAAAGVGMAIGLSTLLLGGTGTLIVLGYGGAAVVVYAVTRWGRRRFDFGGAYRALTKSR